MFLWKDYNTDLIFWKIWSYGIDFGGWHCRGWLVKKIICPINWQQSLWRLNTNYWVSHKLKEPSPTSAAKLDFTIQLICYRATHRMPKRQLPLSTTRAAQTNQFLHIEIMRTDLIVCVSACIVNSKFEHLYFTSLKLYIQKQITSLIWKWQERLGLKRG